MPPEKIRALAIALTAAALALGAAAYWLFRRERRKARGFRGQVRERLQSAAKRRK